MGLLKGSSIFFIDIVALNWAGLQCVDDIEERAKKQEQRLVLGSKGANC
jgi:hypothetical protein